MNEFLTKMQNIQAHSKSKDSVENVANQISALLGQDARQIDMLEFALDDQRYAIALENIKEISSPVNINEIEGAPRHIKGLFINGRGEVLLLIDLCAIYKESSNNVLCKHCVIVEVEGKSFGLMASAVFGHIKVDRAKILSENRQDFMMKSPINLGLLHRENTFINILDVRRIMDLVFHR